MPLRTVSSVSTRRQGSGFPAYNTITSFDGGKIVSISAMPVHQNKRHEGLRLKNYQLGDEGGLPASQLANGNDI
ncbi:hypothetical protein MKX01_027140, partial [Papaver californicum]